MLKDGRLSTCLLMKQACALLLGGTIVFANSDWLVSAFAQEGTIGQPATELTISASFADKQVAADQPIEFRLNRSLSKKEGGLAIIIGQADLTALFTVDEK